MITKYRLFWSRASEIPNHHDQKAWELRSQEAQKAQKARQGQPSHPSPFVSLPESQATNSTPKLAP
ncbi:hypothetical protein VD0002_g10295 [Verticillium dahliae]|nr:hypothetical protein VD0002_g10295 [Verticillium dahliae]